jgi:hypothetical protein
MSAGSQPSPGSGESPPKACNNCGGLGCRREANGEPIPCDLCDDAMVEIRKHVEEAIHEHLAGGDLWMCSHVAAHRIAPLAAAPAGSGWSDAPGQPVAWETRRLEPLWDDWSAWEPSPHRELNWPREQTNGVGIRFQHRPLYTEAQAASGSVPEDAKSPIDMVLHCPKCHTQHVDAPDHQWTNPPHRSHLCHECGHVWRPADVPTNGVAAVKTKGKADHPL